MRTKSPTDLRSVPDNIPPHELNLACAITHYKLNIPKEGILNQKRILIGKQHNCISMSLCLKTITKFYS